MAHDSDPFNRWEAGQRLATRAHAARRRATCARASRFDAPAALRRGVRAACCATRARDPAFAAEALALPSETLSRRADGRRRSRCDPRRAHAASRASSRAALRDELARRLSRDSRCRGPYSPDAAVGRASARCATCASRYLMETRRRRGARARVRAVRRRGQHDRRAWPRSRCSRTSTAPSATAALERFYARWKDEPLVVDKWFARAGDVAPARHARAQ